MEVEFLRTVSILRQLTDDELKAVAALGVVREVQAKERIIEEGTPVTHFSIVMEGIVHIRRMANKREMLLGRLGPGSFFGEINLFDPGMATASIYAMKTTKLISLEYNAIRKLMEENSAIGYKIVSAMMKEMARRLRQTSARLVNSVYWMNAEGAIPRAPAN